MAKTRRYSSRRRARGRKVKHSVKRRVHKKRNNRGRGKSKRRSRGRKHSRRLGGNENHTGVPCNQSDDECCPGWEHPQEERSSMQSILDRYGNLQGWYGCVNGRSPSLSPRREGRWNRPTKRRRRR